MVLIVDVAFYSIYPNTIAAVGYSLVIASSFGMVLAPNIEKWLCSRREAAKVENIEAED